MGIRTSMGERCHTMFMLQNTEIETRKQSSKIVRILSAAELRTCAESQLTTQ